MNPENEVTSKHFNRTLKWANTGTGQFTVIIRPE